MTKFKFLSMIIEKDKRPEIWLETKEGIQKMFSSDYFDIYESLSNEDISLYVMELLEQAVGEWLEDD